MCVCWGLVSACSFSAMRLHWRKACSSLCRSWVDRGPRGREGRVSTGLSRRGEVEAPGPRAPGGKGGPRDAIWSALTWRGASGRWEEAQPATQPGRGMTQQTLRLKPRARPKLGHGPAPPAPAGPASHPEVCPRILFSDPLATENRFLLFSWGVCPLRVLGFSLVHIQV